MAIDFNKPVEADLESTNWLNMRDMYSALTRMVMVGALNRPLGSLALSNPNGTNRTLTQWNGTADVQFDLTVKKLIVVDGIGLGPASASIEANNASVSLNADANDYMQYDRVNNSWRWVIDGAQRLAIGPTAAGISSVNLGNFAGDSSSIFGFQNNSSNVAPLEVTAQRTAAGADWSTAGLRAQRRVDATFMGFVQWGGDKNPAGVSIGAGESATAQGVSYLLHFKDGGRMVTDNVTDDGSTKLQVTTLTAKGRAHTPRVILAYSATPTFDFSLTNVWGMALTGNVTGINIIEGANDGQTSQIRFKQDATGGRTVALPASFKVSGVINTSPNRVTILQVTFTADGNLFEGAWVQVPA
jgi:hypothetical protein